MSYTRRGLAARKLVIGCFVAAYVAVAWVGGRVSPRGEFFPVFNWSLFTKVRPQRSLLELYVHRIGDRTFEKPVNYFELDDYFESARNRNSDVKKLLTQYAAASGAEDTSRMETLRRLIETRHLQGHGDVEYELRYVVFHPVDRWLHGTVTWQEVIARLNTRAEP